jgi:ATP/maltotriose-dependent transcriptional regulator MalT
VEGQALRLALLGECHAGLGDADRARADGAEAVEVARAQGHVIWEAYANLALARILLATGDLDAVEPALTLALRLARRSRTRIFEPPIHVEQAALAGALGDLDRRDRELLEARRLFSEVGAPGQAARLDGMSAPLPAGGSRR